MTPESAAGKVQYPAASAAADPTSSRLGSLRRRWPTAAGLGFAALVAIGMTSGLDMAAVLAAAAVVYLGSAALRTPRAAWPLFFATAVVITVLRLIDDRFEPTWVLFGAGVVLLAYGLLRGGFGPTYGLPLQTLALLGFGVVVTVALLINPMIGSYLVALGLLGHATWDLYHYRINKVVSRSLAEFCYALDATLAVVIVILTAMS